MLTEAILALSQNPHWRVYLKYVNELVEDWEAQILDPKHDNYETQILRYARSRVLEVLELPSAAITGREV